MKKPGFVLGGLAPLIVLLFGCSGNNNNDAGDGTGGACSGQTGLENPYCQLLLPDNAPINEENTPADFSCLGNAPQPPQPTKDLIIRGKTQQRLSNGDDEDKGGVTVEIWVDQSDLSEANRIAKVESGDTGDYEITIPVSAWANATSTGARIAWRISSPDTIPTVEYNDYLDTNAAVEEADKLVLEDQNRITITRSTQQVIVALLGVTFDKSKGIILGTVRDCNRLDTANASVGLVDSAGNTIDGSLVFYFRSNFPVTRDDQYFTSIDGLFVIIDAPPNPASDVRVIGNLGGTKTILSRQLIPVQADTIAIVDFDPLAQPFDE